MTDDGQRRTAPLREHTDRFARLVERADLDARVASCPGWTVGELAVHLGGVHQWAAHAVTAGSPDLEPVPPGPGRSALVDWYRGHADHLVEVLASRSPQAPAWTMDDTDPTAGFWLRRQVLETALHLWDAEQAGGGASPIDPVLAWDGVHEVVDVLYPRQVRLGRVDPLAGALRLVATDVAGQVALGAGEPVEIRSTAESLMLLLWHRLDPVELWSEGIDAGAAALLAGALTP